MSEKRWVFNPCEECEVHGADVEIYTDAEQPESGVCAFDGDPCRCSEGCRGWMNSNEESFFCNWHDEEGGDQ